MKRHPGLITLSRHHHQALVLARELIRQTEAPPAARPRLVRQAADRALAFWNDTGLRHFREEEEILLPAFAAVVPIDVDPDVARLLADHASIRSGIERLRAAPEDGAELSGLLTAMGQELKAHIQFEEEQLFPRIEARLSEAELVALGRRLGQAEPGGR